MWATLSATNIDACKMRSIIPSELVDVEYLLAITQKVKDDVKDEVLIKIEQIRRMHSNFRLRLYRPLPLVCD